MNKADSTYDFILNKICPYCQSKIKRGADFTVCSHCGTPHHRECWNENGGCTTYGCINNPLTEKKVELGSEDVGNETVEAIRESLHAPLPDLPLPEELIECPGCSAEIEKSSLFCKFCGYKIAEENVQKDAGASGSTGAKEEFEKEYKRRYRDKISVTRKRTLITSASFVILISVVAFLFYVSITKLNEYFSSDEYKIKNTVYNWKDAWESKDLEKYKSYLSEDYQYIGKEGKRIDLKDKLKRIESTFKTYKSINISFTDFKMINDTTVNESDKKVQFKENYESDKFKENGLKTLRLYKGVETNGEWKIYREIFE